MKHYYVVNEKLEELYFGDDREKAIAAAVKEFDIVGVYDDSVEEFEFGRVRYNEFDEYTQKARISHNATWYRINELNEVD